MAKHYPMMLIFGGVFRGLFVYVYVLPSFVPGVFSPLVCSPGETLIAAREEYVEARRRTVSFSYDCAGAGGATRSVTQNFAALSG
jgi:hypothetical protein